MNRFLIIILLLIANLNSNSQSVNQLLEEAKSIYSTYPDSSFNICIEAEEYAVKENDEVKIGFSKLCKARYFLLKNRLEECSDELEEAINLFSKNDSKLGMATAYIAMSNIAGRIKKDENEIEYLERANNIFIQLNDTNGLIRTYSNLALNYIHYGMLKEGENALISLEKLTESFPEREFYFLNQNWGILYVEKENFKAAHRRFESARKVAVRLKMTDSEATCLYLIAELYQKENDYENALINIQNSLKIAVDNDLVIEELEALELLKKIYDYKKETSNAYETFQRIVAIKDTIYNLKRINKLNEYEKEIELSEKEKIIIEQNLNIEKNKAQLLKDKYEIYILGAVLALVSISVIYLIISIRNKQKANQIISKQKEEVEQQKKIVDEKNYQILSSITYAKRIQEAILPQDKIVKEYLTKSFVFYKAKDIVSGDFYWMEQIDDVILFAVIDCTGHGVPGAFMSIVGNNGLNKAVRELKLSKPSQILDALNLYVSKSLHQDTKDVKDGMDISLCSLNLKTNELEYSGAFNPLYILKNGSDDIEIIKADKQPIGDAKDLYKNHKIQLNEGDSIYIFTDGYADQFGGDKGKKFSYKQFRSLLIENRNLTMMQQREILNQKFELWSKNEEQVDDICVIGVRV